jgi:hypothetical protein
MSSDMLDKFSGSSISLLIVLDMVSDIKPPSDWLDMVSDSKPPSDWLDMVSDSRSPFG